MNFWPKGIHGLLFCCVFSGYIFSHLNSGSHSQSNVDLIVFSFNRPLQLYSFLESVYKYTSNLSKISVLYRSENEKYESAYQEVQQLFPEVFFIRQGKRPKVDFKPLLLQCFNSSSEYIVFGVDDIIVKDYIDFDECISVMKKIDAHGFFLRLGKNITRVYNGGYKVQQPKLYSVKKDIFRFTIKKGVKYWGYPNNVDMTIYKKSVIEKFFKSESYTSPNKLEAKWSSKSVKNRIGLCFETSKILNIPLNIVQRDFSNKHEDSFSPKKLLDLWNNRLKLDIDFCFQMNNESPHVGLIPLFIER